MWRINWGEVILVVKAWTWTEMVAVTGCNHVFRVLPNSHTLHETQEPADVTFSEKMIKRPDYLGLKLHYRNTSISDAGFL